MLQKLQTSSLPECKPRPRPSLALVFLSLTICFVLVLACCGQHDPQKSMAALKLFQSILGPRGPTSKKPSMAAFKGTQDPLGPRSPTPLKKQMLAHSRGHVRPLGGEGGGGLGAAKIAEEPADGPRPRATLEPSMICAERRPCLCTNFNYSCTNCV